MKHKPVIIGDATLYLGDCRVSPDGNWYPTPLDEISPRKIQVAQR